MIETQVNIAISIDLVATAAMLVEVTRFRVEIRELRKKILEQGGYIDSLKSKVGGD